MFAPLEDFDTLCVNHPEYGLVIVGTDARAANATPREIVERFVKVVRELDKQMKR